MSVPRPIPGFQHQDQPSPDAHAPLVSAEIDRGGWGITRPSRYHPSQGADLHALFGYQEKCFDYYGYACCCIGMEHPAAPLAEIGIKDEAARIADEAHRYRADILASMKAATRLSQ